MSKPSVFSNVELAPRDPILGLTEAFNADTRSNKVNLGVGVYYDYSGKLPLLEAVRISEQRRLQSSAAKGYQPIDGSASYNRAVRDLSFGKDSAANASGKIVTVQSLGGTGALKLGADYLLRLFPQSTAFISNPSWENHRAIFETAGFKVESYDYYDNETRRANHAAMLASLESMPSRSVVVLHACCHNPTGADLNAEEWRTVVDICRQRGLIPFLDMAYQGFAEGIEEDAVAIRSFADADVQFLLAGSFSKSFSLYGERVGALSVVTGSKDEATRVQSQLKRLIRTNYSNPPTHGGAIVSDILGDPELRSMWERELAGMRERIRSVRQSLVVALQREGVSRDFTFINSQRGMFSYTGLASSEIERLQNEHAIYAVSSGRICVAALNSNNVDGVAKAIASVLR